MRRSAVGPVYPPAKGNPQHHNLRRNMFDMNPFSVARPVLSCDFCSPLVAPRPSSSTHRSVYVDHSHKNRLSFNAAVHISMQNYFRGSPAATGWTRAYTESGKEYYRNNRDQTTSWDKPVASGGSESHGDGARALGSGSSKSDGRGSSRGSRGVSERSHEAGGGGSSSPLPHGTLFGCNRRSSSVCRFKLRGVLRPLRYLLRCVLSPPEEPVCLASNYEIVARWVSASIRSGSSGTRLPRRALCIISAPTPFPYR